MGLARMAGGAGTALLLGFALTGCAPDLHAVDDGAYGALVPSAQQWADAGAKDIPGGFAALNADGVNRITVSIAADTVTFMVDGRTAATRAVEQRLDIEDREGSGAFKAHSEVLSLGEDPLVLGSLRIEAPVIWYSGGYRSTALIAVKPWDPNERGPIAQCTAADRQCLELPVGETLAGDPLGVYTKRTDPSTFENPVAGIRVSATEIVYTLDTGQEVRTAREGEYFVSACALRESTVWRVPAEVGLALKDPVLVDTDCPLPTGNPPSLTVMERQALPVLAPLGQGAGGQWCQPGPACVWFVDEEGTSG